MLEKGGFSREFEKGRGRWLDKMCLKGALERVCKILEKLVLEASLKANK